MKVNGGVRMTINEKVSVWVKITRSVRVAEDIKERKTRENR
jgi:hypothetical protein